MSLVKTRQVDTLESAGGRWDTQETTQMSLPKRSELQPRQRHPSAFLLPMCEECDTPLSLASVEPDPTDAHKEIRTFRCPNCGAEQACILDLSLIHI